MPSATHAAGPASSPEGSPDRRSPRGRRGGELRLALFRGQRPAERLRRPEQHPVRESVHHRHLQEAVLQLQPVRDNPSRGCLPVPDRRLQRGVRFYDGVGNYPNEYDGAMFFADYARNCLMVMRAGADGRPVPSTLQEFSTTVEHPVDLELGPGATCSTSTSSGARCVGSPTAAPTSPRSPWPARPPRPGQWRPPCRSRRQGRGTLRAVRSPTPGTWTATAATTTPPVPAPPAGTPRPAGWSSVCRSGTRRGSSPGPPPWSHRRVRPRAHDHPVGGVADLDRRHDDEPTTR